MKKRIFVLGLLTITLIATTFIFCLYNWPGSNRIFVFSILILAVINIVVIIRNKGKRFRLLILGIGSIVLLIIGTGTVFKMMNWSNTIFWPVNESLSFIKTENEPYNWVESKSSPLISKAQQFEKQFTNKAFMRSLLIIHRDSIILEKYYYGCNKYYAFNIASCTKSITSAIVGLAIDKGLINSEEDLLKEYIPEYYRKQVEKSKEKITIKHLLTMQAGWTFGKQNGQNLSGMDWIRSSMINPLNFEPGKAFSYNNIEPHILLQIIDKKSENGIIDFANINLLEPIGITIAHWGKNQKGQYFGGGSIFMTSRDMARFGQLYLRNGQINGKQVISKDWIGKSQIDYVTKNLMPQRTPAKGYGYLWWVDNYNENIILQAAGSGGQHIFIVPKTDMIIVTTAEMNVPPRLTFENSIQIIDIVNNFIYGLLDSQNR